MLLNTSGLSTALDNIDYDNIYQVNIDNSDRAFHSIKEYLGCYLKNSYKAILEIGAGTGGFTVSLLKNIAIETAVITDISPNMLEICRKRLNKFSINASKSTIFATHSGVEDCLSYNKYDLIVGSFVLHHILDYEAHLNLLWSALRPGASAIFIEPNYRFHRALVNAMLEVIASMQTARWAKEIDISLVANWVWSNYYNLVHAGDINILRQQEDKHLFVSDKIEYVGDKIGFSETKVIAYGEPDYGINAVNVYTKQLGLSESVRQKVITLFASYSPRHFEQLNPIDATPSYFFVFTKAQDGKRKEFRNKKITNNPFDAIRAVNALPIYRHLKFEFNRNNNLLRITGWACSPAEIRFLVLTFENITHKIAFNRIRHDVSTAINSKHIIPFPNALFCGMESEISVKSEYTVDNKLTIEVSYELRDGRLVKGNILICGSTELVEDKNLNINLDT